jgi:hypothetical protein
MTSTMATPVAEYRIVSMLYVVHAEPLVVASLPVARTLKRVASAAGKTGADHA